MLRRCGPLLDSVRFAVTFLKWSTALAVVGFALPILLARQQMEPSDLRDASIFVAVLVMLQLMGSASYWLLMSESGGKKDLCLFLRAFRSDASSDQLRAWLKAAMGPDWHLGGIRPPAERASLWVTLLSPLFTGLKYLGSRQFEMVAPDHNWMARLLASFAQTRMVFIDIRDVTPHVLDEIRLAWQVFGPQRTLFIIDTTRSPEAWKDTLHQQLGADRTQFRLLIWHSDAATFVPQVQFLLAQIPSGTASVTPEALAFVHGKVGPENWDVRPIDRAWVQALLQQLVLAAGGGLLYLIHPWARMLGFGLLGLEALHLYRVAWCRARRQRLDALAVNPAGPPSAKRLWGSLALMLTILASPILFMIVATIMMVASAGENIARARITKAEADMTQIGMALTMYQARGGQPPTTEQGLDALVNKPTREPIPQHWRVMLEELPMDPWSHPYRYESPARRSTTDPYDLWSTGPDGIDGTADDIGNFNAR